MKPFKSISVLVILLLGIFLDNNSADCANSIYKVNILEIAAGSIESVVQGNHCTIPFRSSTQQESPVKIYKPIRPKALPSEWVLVSPYCFEFPFLLRHGEKKFTLFEEQSAAFSFYEVDQLRGPPFFGC